MSKRPSTADRDPSVTDSGDGDEFLSRWARRKALARRGADPDAAPAGASRAGDARADELPARVEAVPEGDEADAPELTDEDMPPLETIDENTDMSGFFSSKVSQAVKKAALRKFFHNPAFNVVDGLDDYDDDFRSFQALGDIITSDMRSQMDREIEREREQAPSAGPGSESAAPEQALSEEVDEQGGADPEQAASDGDDTGTHEAAADTGGGVTREPDARPRISHGKLRPRGAADEDA